MTKEERIRYMGEKISQRRQDDGRLSLLPILTERKVGPSRFPCGGWRQVANCSRLASGSVGRLGSQRAALLKFKRREGHCCVAASAVTPRRFPPPWSINRGLSTPPGLCIPQARRVLTQINAAKHHKRKVFARQFNNNNGMGTCRVMPRHIETTKRFSSIRHRSERTKRWEATHHPCWLRCFGSRYF
jgi:hypothetical protein